MDPTSVRSSGMSPRVARACLAVAMLLLAVGAIIPLARDGQWGGVVVCSLGALIVSVVHDRYAHHGPSSPTTR